MLKFNYIIAATLVALLTGCTPKVIYQCDIPKFEEKTISNKYVLPNGNFDLKTTDILYKGGEYSLVEKDRMEYYIKYTKTKKTNIKECKRIINEYSVERETKD